MARKTLSTQGAYVSYDAIDLPGMLERFEFDLDKDLSPIMKQISVEARATAKREAQNEFPVQRDPSRTSGGGKRYEDSFHSEVQRPSTRRLAFSIVVWNDHPVARILESGQRKNYYKISGSKVLAWPDDNTSAIDPTNATFHRGGVYWYSNDYSEFGRMNGHHVLKVTVETIADEWFVGTGDFVPSGKRVGGQKFRAPGGQFSGTRRAQQPRRSKPLKSESFGAPGRMSKRG